MARRSDHNKEELVQMAVKAGHALIQAEGFSAFSTRKVASAMGYTVGTLYHLFGNADMLILHINACTLDKWYEVLHQRMQEHPKFDVLDLALFYIDYSKTHPHEWSALFEHRMPPGLSLPQWYMPKMNRFFAVIEQLVMPYVANEPVKARRAARVLWAGIHGICVLAHSGKLDLAESESATILAQSLVRGYLSGLAA